MHAILITHIIEHPMHNLHRYLVWTFTFYSLGLEHLKPAELEMVTQCKLLLADIARQRHHAGIAVDTAFSAMKMLKYADVFNDKQRKAKQEQMR